jgi:hypothetical protein
MTMSWDCTGVEYVHAHRHDCGIFVVLGSSLDLVPKPFAVWIFVQTRV